MNDPNVEAFLALVERHRRYMYNLALRMTGNEQDAKDVVQDSLLNAFVNFDRFEGRADLRTWLNRILVNCALDHLRRLRRRPDMHDAHPIADVADVAASGSPDPERLAASADCRPVVAAATGRTNPRGRLTLPCRP